VLGAKMIVSLLQADGTYKLDPALTAAFPKKAAAQPIIAKFNAYKLKLLPLVTQKCDGCLCAPTGSIKGVAIAVPDEILDTFPFSNPADGKATVFVTGVTARIRMGICVAPGTDVFEHRPDGTRRKILAEDRPPDINPDAP
jgi:hypothetical protein